VADSPPASGPLVAVCSLFRNSADTLDYFRAVIGAQERAGVRLVFSFVEGDSTDDTYERLTAWAAEDPRVTVAQQHVEPVLDFDDRVRKWAALGNLAIEGALATHADYILWCESDLALPHDLLAQLLASESDIVAPAIFMGGLFYDIWGFRGMDGVRFTGEAPYHRDFHPHGRVQLSSVGSCVLFGRAVFEAGVRFRGTYEDGLLVGVCHDAGLLGFRTYVDTRVAVLHPTTLWRRQQYTLERVDVDCEPSQDEAWADVARDLASEVTLTLGTIEYEGEHPVDAPVHAIVNRHLPGRPHRIRVSLASEGRKTYAITVEDLALGSRR
jgi:Cryptococcal mannosyltransferase 1